MVASAGEAGGREHRHCRRGKHEVHSHQVGEEAGSWGTSSAGDRQQGAGVMPLDSSATWSSHHLSLFALLQWREEMNLR